MKTCRLKICGLSRFGDILAANDILPDYIGFVFAESSRRVTPDKAAQLRQELDKRIKADRRKPGVIIEMRKSEMLYDIVALINDKVITQDDLEEFSDELKEYVQFLLDRNYGK